MTAFAILCAVLYVGLLLVTWIDAALDEVDAARDALADQGDVA